MHRVLGFFVALVVGSCAGEGNYACSSSQECDPARGGICEPVGFCSFPDIGCKSGRRYADHSGNLSNACVSPTVGGVATGTSAGSTDDGDGDSSTGLALTSGADGSTGAGSTSTSTGAVDSSSGGSESSTGTVSEDPYGDCTSTCGYPGAACLIDAGGNAVCAPACTEVVSPSDECPAAPEAGFEVGCFELADGMGTRCFIPCVDSACPTGMGCASGVCTWP